MLFKPELIWVFRVVQSSAPASAKTTPTIDHSTISIPASSRTKRFIVTTIAISEDLSPAYPVFLLRSRGRARFTAGTRLRAERAVADALADVVQAGVDLGLQGRPEQRAREREDHAHDRPLHHFHAC